MKSKEKVIFNPDEETPVSIIGDVVRADWYRAGEGYWGDYNPNNPNDRELLRFDIYKNVNGEWEEVDDASYCTNVTADTDIDRLVTLLKTIYHEYDNVLSCDPDASVKNLGEALSWIA